MNNDQAASQYPPDPRPITWIVQADYYRRADMASENRPQRSEEEVFVAIKDMMDRGATEIRIRPFKEHPTNS